MNIYSAYKVTASNAMSSCKTIKETSIRMCVCVCFFSSSIWLAL